ncbi:protein shisa-like-1a [Acipenser ruthenus]|uniref:protein shisa-like-1a n=1 Tax=Acipenser ruthenus TaxID=7906 RepID=UPI002740628E|nr:protein shisa-like-1a [Acipenser ruthenus]
MLCEGYYDLQDFHHSGFYCPRLSDPPEHSYCCRQGILYLKYCCNQSEFQDVMNVNLSESSTSQLFHSKPLTLMAVGFYIVLVLTLMIVDFLWFCRLRDLTVLAALRKYLTCPRWINSILRPNRQPSHYHSNRNLTPHRNRQGAPPCLPGDQNGRSASKSCHGDQSTEFSHLDPEVNSDWTEDDMEWSDD